MTDKNFNMQQSATTKMHELKLREDFADDVCMGYKPFEVRQNDRGFQKGDKIKFNCVNMLGYRLLHAINDKVYEITYVLSGWGIKEGYVALGIREIKEVGGMNE